MGKVKNHISKIISWVCVITVIILLAFIPLLASSSDTSEEYVQSILSGTVERMEISSSLSGGGPLIEQDAIEISIPAGVKLTQFLAENDELVKTGDSLATVDRVSVMTAIAQVQESLAYLAEELETVNEQADSNEIIAQAGGRVKQIYAETGENVQDVMLEHGALAVLSLDGKMGVQLEAETNLSVGSSVSVTLAGGTEVTGRVESTLGGTLVVTVPDEGYAVDEMVQVFQEDGTILGTGALYIHNALKVTAYSGIIDEITIETEETVDAGDKMFTLTGFAYTAEFEMLSAKHREYEDLMLELFKLYQDTTITAPCDGVVSGVDEECMYLLSKTNQGWAVTFLVNSPYGDEETTYTNYVGQVAEITNSGWHLNINPTSLAITDYKDLSGVTLDTSAMTHSIGVSPNVPIYSLSGDEWQQISSNDISVGDILLFAGDEGGNIVWAVWIATGIIEPEPTTPPETTVPITPPEITEPMVPPEIPDPATPSDSVPTEPNLTDPSVPTTEPVQPTVPAQTGTQPPQTGGSISGYPKDNYSGGTYNGGNTAGTVQTEFELYKLERSTILYVTKQETMTISITVDEMDISKIVLGQTAEVTIDVLHGQVFSATVTKIGFTGVNSGGNTKFTVGLTMDRTENMLPGMNATATIILSTTGKVLTIPVAALYEKGAETIVYTGYNSETGKLLNPVVVTTGVSDGQRAEVLCGIEEGTTYFYAYYDTLKSLPQLETAYSPSVDNTKALL